MFKEVAVVVTMLFGSNVLADDNNCISLLNELEKTIDSLNGQKTSNVEVISQLRNWISLKRSSFSQNQNLLEILKPTHNSKVPQRPLITGKIGSSCNDVWLIVHPMETSDYWVQPPVSVRKDGTWEAYIYIGRTGSIDSGKKFELLAIANPIEKLNEGQVLRNWPKGKQSSDFIKLIRE